jgi:hypothetical protein
MGPGLICQRRTKNVPTGRSKCVPSGVEKRGRWPLSSW